MGEKEGKLVHETISSTGMWILKKFLKSGRWFQLSEKLSSECYAWPCG